MADLVIHDVPPRLKEGILLAERGGLDKAQTLFENYLETHLDSALALSYAGMLTAAKGGDVHKGLDMCREAARKDPGEALCFLNLARVHLMMGDRYQSVRAIHKGLKLRQVSKWMGTKTRRIGSYGQSIMFQKTQQRVTSFLIFGIEPEAVVGPIKRFGCADRILFDQIGDISRAYRVGRRVV